MLGKYHAQKYKNNTSFKELMNGIVAKNLDVDSTDYYRTIQSVYSQLLGLQEHFGNSKAIVITAAQVSALKSPTVNRSTPRFAVRRIQNLSDLSNTALSQNYIQVPVFSWMKPLSSDLM